MKKDKNVEIIDTMKVEVVEKCHKLTAYEYLSEVGVHLRNAVKNTHLTKNG